MKTRILTLIIMVCSMLGGQRINAKSIPQAANEVSGKLMDYQTEEAIAFATVAIVTEDGTVVDAGTSNEDGTFSLSAPNGSFIFKASLLGYKNQDREINVKAQNIDLGEIKLEPDQETLNAARVTEKMPMIEMKIDKIVFNVSQSAFAQNSNAMEMLKKSPGVTVDKDGNVKLNGKSVSIWIDGRPSHLDGKSLEAMLKSTEGSSLDKIELMEHPSAKYDAAGQGGIINIKTKRNVLSGLHGSMNFSGSGMYFNDIDNWISNHQGGVNVSYRTKKTNTFLNVNADHDTMYQLEQMTQTSAAVPGVKDWDKQYSETMLDIWSKALNTKIGTDWFINDKNTLGFIVSVPYTKVGMNSLPGYNFIEEYNSGSLLKKDTSVMKTPGTYLQQSYNVNYTHVFDPAKAREITVNLDYFINENDSDNESESYDATTGVQNIGRSVLSNQAVKIVSAKADYQSVMFGRAMFEAGAKWSRSLTDASVERTFLGAQPSATEFEYAENIGAVYADAAAQLSAKWSVKAGLRGEYTKSDGESFNGGQTGTVNREYFDVFPTLFVGFTPGQNLNLSLSYTRRIQRPSYSQLDPSEVYIDATNAIAGNPDLQPSYTNGVFLSSNFYKYFSATLGYNYTADMQTQLAAVKDGRTMLMWGNYGEQHMGIASANISELPITKWLTWSLNASGMYSKSTSASGAMQQSLPSIHTYTSLTAMLPKDWKVELNAYGHSKMIWGNMEILPNWSANAGVRKVILDGKVTLNMDFSDIFRTMTTDIIMKADSLDLNIGQKIYMQSVSVGATWNFGKASGPMRHRKVGGLEEASRTGGSSTKIGQN